MPDVPLIRSVHERMKRLPELRRDPPLVPPPKLRERLPDQRFRKMISIALGRVEQVDPHLLGLGQDFRHSVNGEVMAPFPAELPSAQSDDGDAQAGLSESPIFHLTYCITLIGFRFRNRPSPDFPYRP